MSLILMKTYNGIFHSALTIPEFEPTIETMDQLIAVALSPNHRIITIESSAYHGMFTKAQCCGPYHKIGRAMNNSGSGHAKSIANAIQILNRKQETKIIYLGTQRIAQYAMRQISKIKLHFSSGQLMNDQTGMVVAKGSYLLPTLNNM